MSLIGGSRTGCLQDISSRTGYHACVCQVGVIITIAAWSFLIFARQRQIIEKGGKL